MVDGTFRSRQDKGASETPQRAATALLNKPMRVFDPNHSSELLTLPLSDLLTPSHLPELLFGAIPTRSHSSEGNADVYGPGQEEIHHVFAQLRSTLAHLARTGSCNPATLSDGADALERLIDGVRTAEDAANPTFAVIVGERLKT